MLNNIYTAVAGVLKRPRSNENLDILETPISESLSEVATQPVSSAPARREKTRKFNATTETGDIDTVGIDAGEGNTLLEASPTGIEKALKDKLIYEADREWISTTQVHIYRDPENVLYDTWLTRINKEKPSDRNETLVFQIFESDGNSQYVLSRSDGRHIRQIYALCPLKELEILISVHNSEIQKRESEGYRRVELDNTMETKILDAAPSEKVLEARRILYGLLGYITVISPSTLPPRKLVARSVEYDALAAKNISKHTIKRGEEALSKLKEAIIQNSGSSPNTDTKKSLRGNIKEDVSELISEYCGCIPHIPPLPIDLLDNLKGIEKELYMLKNLKTIRDSAILANKINLGDNGHDDKLRGYFKSLKLKNIDFVDINSEEFKLIERYFVNTNGRCGVPAAWKFRVFRIEREGDEERWNAAGWDKMANGDDNRRLLWHGTPLANIPTILREGLKDIRKIGGVFFSDTAFTSLSYCRRLTSASPVAMFLCEVQLGHLKAGYNGLEAYTSAGKIGRQRGSMNYTWVNAGPVNKSLEGVLMPDARTTPITYTHVEWIATNSPSQVKHRYLVICQP